MRWAFAQEDMELWKPKRRASPKLARMGIVTATAAVRIEFKVTE